MPTETFWPTAATDLSGENWVDPFRAFGEPDGEPATHNSPGQLLTALELSGYDFSGLPDDAVISAFAVVAHASHTYDDPISLLAAVYDADDNPLGGVEVVSENPAFAAVTPSAEMADETVITHEAWTPLIASKAELVAAVGSVRVSGQNGLSPPTWSIDAVGVRVTYTIAPKPGHPMMNDTCTIRRKTTSVSAATGTPTHEWEDWSLNVPCSVQADSSSEGGDHLRESGRATYRVYLPYGTDVQTTDRLVWQGRTLSVVGPPIDGAGRRVYYRVPAEEVTSGGQR